MNDVLKSNLLDITIDKLSIVADFKEGIKKRIYKNGYKFKYAIFIAGKPFEKFRL